MSFKMNSAIFTQCNLASKNVYVHFLIDTQLQIQLLHHGTIENQVRAMLFLQHRNQPGGRRRRGNTHGTLRRGQGA